MKISYSEMLTSVHQYLQETRTFKNSDPENNILEPRKRFKYNELSTFFLQLRLFNNFLRHFGLTNRKDLNIDYCIYEDLYNKVFLL